LPGIGFALGLDRILLASRDHHLVVTSVVDAFVVAATPEVRTAAFALVTRLRRAGIGADFDSAGRSMKAQMKDAARRAPWAVILGPAELEAGAATLRDLTSGEQEQVPLDDLERRLS
jgi:histidyl-tRNA synthetase